MNIKKILNKIWFNNNNREYIMIIGDTKKKLSKILDLILSLKKKRMIIGIDFEFNRVKDRRRVALCQLNLELEERGYILYFNPDELNKRGRKIFLDLLLSDNYKLLHGGDSLDIPYLIDNILKENKNIIEFSKKYVDTKFLCEYDNIKLGIEGSCKINNFLLRKEVITEKQYNYLIESEEKMGRIETILVDIRKLDELLTIYTLSDVLYLPSLFRKMDNYVDVIEMNGLITYLRKGESDYDILVSLLQKMDNFYDEGEGMRYRDYYKRELELLDEGIREMLKINYYKKIIENILKMKMYNRLLKKKIDLNLGLSDFRVNLLDKVV